MTEVSKLETVKKIVKSCVLAGKGLNLRELEASYKEQEGSAIPYGQLGFPTLIRFLEYIPDTVRLDRGMIYPVASQSNAHIQKLVMETTSKTRRKPGQRQSGPRFHQQQFQHNQPRPQQCFQPRFQPRAQTPRFQQSFFQPDPCSIPQRIPPPFAPTVERILARTDPTNDTRQIRESDASCAERALKNKVRIAQEQMIKNQAARNIPVTQAKEYYHEAESDGGTVNSLLDEFDDAYTGFVNMKLNESARNAQQEANELEAKIKAAAPPESGSAYQLIFICEVSSPHQFWFQTEDHYKRLDDLMDEMDEFYSKCSIGQLTVPADKLRIGRACAGCYGNVWHRVEIVDCLDNGDIEVVLVDYGTKIELSPDLVKALAEQFLIPSAQCHIGALDGIGPIDHHWTRKSSIDFVGMVRDRFLYAQVGRVDQTTGVAHMKVIDTNGEKDFVINDQLVQKRHAQRTDQRDKKWK